MKLEEIVKSLKVGECVKIKTTDEKYVLIEPGEKYILIELGRTDEGKYNFIFESYNEFETVDVVFFSKEFETVGELLDYIAKHFADWLEYDYEVYKTRAELKSEVKQLKKALKSACKIIEDGEMCSVCPANDFCHNSDRTCAEDIFDELMKEAAK